MNAARRVRRTVGRRATATANARDRTGAADDRRAAAHARPTSPSAARSAEDGAARDPPGDCARAGSASTAPTGCAKSDSRRGSRRSVVEAARTARRPSQRRCEWSNRPTAGRLRLTPDMGRLDALSRSRKGSISGGSRPIGGCSASRSIPEAGDDREARAATARRHASTPCGASRWRDETRRRAQQDVRPRRRRPSVRGQDPHAQAHAARSPTSTPARETLAEFVEEWWTRLRRPEPRARDAARLRAAVERARAAAARPPPAARADAADDRALPRRARGRRASASRRSARR